MIRVLVRKAQLAFILIGAAGLAGIGCNKSSDTSSAPEPMSGPGGPGPTSAEVLAKLPGGEEFASGKRVYADNNCARCHKLGETGGGGATPAAPPGSGGPTTGVKGRGGMKGPDLTAVGADPAHTKDWIAAHIRDPKAHKPRSSMPASGPDKIPDPDLDALAAYLASRK